MYVDDSKSKILENIKNKSISTLQEAIKYGKTTQNINSAQNQIDKSYHDMKKVLEETIHDQYYFKNFI